MKPRLLLFSFLLPFLSMAQNHDHVWMLGYQSWTGHPLAGNTKIDFNTYPPLIEYQYSETDFRQANTSMSDGEGSLLFYSNGLSVTNHLHETMENGDGINPGEYANNQDGSGYILIQGATALPAPGMEGQYYLIHLSKDYPNDYVSWHSPLLYYSLIDMSANSGEGKVIEKNVPVVVDTMGQGQLAAVRHGNGRDWWLLKHEYLSRSYHRILVDPDGVHSLGTDSVEMAVPKSAIGQSVFSPDGRFYIRINAIDEELGPYLDIYDFDRCSGLLSNQRREDYDDGVHGLGVVVSPSSRYLYVTAYRYIYQYDLHAPDILGTKELVAVRDSFYDVVGTSSYPTSINFGQLAPDGKIYVCTFTGTRYLHVIHSPDKPCPDCGIEQHGIYLERFNRASIPNHPNYRLGPLDGSPCDTLGLDNLPVARFRFEQDSSNSMEVEFTDLSHYEPEEWSWDFGGTGTSSEKHPVYEFPSGGTYEVCLTVGNGNGEDTFCRTLHLGTVATGESEKEFGVTLFPNPAREGVNVILSDGYLPRDGKVVLYDAVGQVRLEKKVFTGWNNVRLDGLSPGIYFYEVKDGEMRLGSGKLVVE